MKVTGLVESTAGAACMTGAAFGKAISFGRITAGTADKERGK